MDITTIYQQFPTDSDCLIHLEKIRWAGDRVAPIVDLIKQQRVPRNTVISAIPAILLILLPLELSSMILN